MSCKEMVKRTWPYQCLRHVHEASKERQSHRAWPVHALEKNVAYSRDYQCRGRGQETRVARRFCHVDHEEIEACIADLTRDRRRT